MLRTAPPPGPDQEVQVHQLLPHQLVSLRTTFKVRLLPLHIFLHIADERRSLHLLLRPLHFHFFFLTYFRVSDQRTLCSHFVFVNTLRDRRAVPHACTVVINNERSLRRWKTGYIKIRPRAVLCGVPYLELEARVGLKKKGVIIKLDSMRHQ